MKNDGCKLSVSRWIWLALIITATNAIYEVDEYKHLAMAVPAIPLASWYNFEDQLLPYEPSTLASKPVPFNSELCVHCNRIHIFRYNAHYLVSPE